ncbi:MAG: patatin-like phospholipase family protein [Polyangiaceae bacterium]|nr:patatin-like phospholipase family protein [Polyangiaceae bacterium]
MTEISRTKVALCLPGGGTSAAMFQVGALAALEDGIEGFDANAFDLYIGTSSGATVAAPLAGARSIQRIYRAVIDPADPYFGLETKHLLRADFGEWRRTLVSGLGAMKHGARSLFSREDAPAPRLLLEELERLYDSLPAGFFTLDRYERFLENFFSRRGIPNSFALMPRALRIMAHDLDSGEQVLFGTAGYEHVPVTRACIASMASPPYFSPVRIGDRHYIDPGAAQVSHLDVAVKEGAGVIVVINPMVPVNVQSVPTGHGHRESVRDKGMVWVLNQSLRIGIHRLLHESLGRIRATSDVAVALVEPEPEDGALFMYSPANFAARRNILEHAYRSTRALVHEWFASSAPFLEKTGWRPKERSSEPAPENWGDSMMPPR